MSAGKIRGDIAKHKPQRNAEGDQICMAVSASETAQGLPVEDDAFPRETGIEKRGRWRFPAVLIRKQDKEAERHNIGMFRHSRRPPTVYGIRPDKNMGSSDELEPVTWVKVEERACLDDDAGNGWRREVMTVTLYGCDCEADW
ncbi:hypothetical protein K443DRAFT_676533 [Laccaria amethystina LaAM-08-1]|uniref:Uncharacterized protein n=1 Tax=Laccaria amethystina LaAM-08-1 TaxID=1095629 RepID=A0A0C9Y6L3_9AGAR|nr:hypothetical protein K443DRAFT_676533 [Laccaria amethystina LaAM-08-1]